MSGMRMVLSCLVVAASALAQRESTRSVEMGDDTPALEVRTAETFTGLQRPGGFLWTWVTLKNPDKQPHDVTVEMGDASYSRMGFAAQRSLRLKPGEESRFCVPMPPEGWSQWCSIDVDGRWKETWHVGSASRGVTTCVLGMVTRDARVAEEWGKRLDSAYSVAGGSGLGSSAIAWVPATFLPDRWMFMSGVDVLFVDAGDPDLTPERQRVIVDYVAAGGTLVVLDRKAVAALEGPLRELVSEGLGSNPKLDGRHRFGRWCLTDREVGMDLPSVLTAAVTRFGGSSGADPATSGFPEDGLMRPIRIPNLGNVPVILFVSLIGLFILAVLVQVRRLLKRREGLRIVFTLPLTGLVFAAVILGYGMFSEGLGTKAAVRAFTILDQRRHETASAVQREVYAGLSPGALTPSAGTLVGMADVGTYRGSQGSFGHEMKVDLDAGGRLAGNAVPARTPTHLATVTVDRSRERLRFKRTGDGGLSVVPDAAFAIDPAEATLVVCDFAGRYFVRKADGSMRSVAERDAWDAVLKLVKRFGDLEWRDEPSRGVMLGPGVTYRPRRSGRGPVAVPVVPFGSSPPDPREVLERWAVEQLGSTLEHGTYVALMTRAPYETLGLSSDDVVSIHLVNGILAEEDFGE